MAERSFKDDLKSTVKSRAIQGISNSLFSSGVVGSALKKTFKRKLAGGQEDQEDTVAAALKEQQEVIADNDMTLVRIERIVTNIADNIYNIAGIMNAQVVSMREAQRDREQARSRDMAAREESLSEATREVAPTAAGTTSSSPEETKKGGLVSSLMGTVGKTKRMFGAFLKKFGVAAVAIAGTLAATTAAVAALKSGQDSDEEGDGEEGEGTGETTPTPETPPVSDAVGPTPPEPPAPPSAPTPVVPEQSQMMSQFSQMTASVPGGDKAAKEMAPFMNVMGSDNPIASFIAAAQDHAARNPQPPAQAPAKAPTPSPEVVSQPQVSSSPPSGSQKSNEELISGLQENLQNNKKRLAQRENAYQKRVEFIKTRYASEPDKLKEMLDAEQKGIDDYRAFANDSNQRLEARIDELKAQGPAGGASAGASMSASGGGGGVSSAPPATSAAGGGGGSGGGGGGAAGGGGGGASAPPAAPVMPNPSTGADVGSASTQVASDLRTAQNTTPPVQTVSTDATSSSVGGQAPSVLPSPIADRGSLDRGTTFESAT